MAKVVDMEKRGLERKDGRVIIHFDYDCFYASVFEAENPALKSLPLAVQQKQIIVTCNYEARKRGLHKLQLIKEARRLCPDVIIVLGEDLTRFRNASKDLYQFLVDRVWSKKAERLGFDEVFLDISDMVDYNCEFLNPHDLQNSFFHLDQSNPTIGFAFDASRISGPIFPAAVTSSLTKLPWDFPSISSSSSDPLEIRLRIGSHLASYLRLQMEEAKGYTATVGISTSKLLSKLVGNVNKPKRQTTLVPPYSFPGNGEESNVTKFIDSHELSKIPGIGYKTAQIIRRHILGREAAIDPGLIYGSTKENVTARDVRLHANMGPKCLEKLLSGPGSSRSVGIKIWGLLNGVDDTEVGVARKVPSQISIEDSYIRLDTMEEVRKELRALTLSLLKRMHLDLTEVDEDDGSILDGLGEVSSGNPFKGCKWLAHPRTIRLTTRPRPPLRPDGTRIRSFNRISRSGAMPSFVFNLNDNMDSRVERLVEEALVPMFRKLHPEKSGWNLSLVNVGATNMAETASDDKSGAGRDISRMFRRQEDVLKEWKFEDKDISPHFSEDKQHIHEKRLGEQSIAIASYGHVNEYTGSEDMFRTTQESSTADSICDNEDAPGTDTCRFCGATMPSFAMVAHERFHSMTD